MIFVQKILSHSDSFLCVLGPSYPSFSYGGADQNYQYDEDEDDDDDDEEEDEEESSEDEEDLRKEISKIALDHKSEDK